MLGRRRFLRGSLALAGSGLLAGCGPVSPSAPAPANVRRVGFLGDTPSQFDVFRERMRELG